jgi:hypothetical protein
MMIWRCASVAVEKKLGFGLTPKSYFMGWVTVAAHERCVLVLSRDFWTIDDFLSSVRGG